MGKKNDSQRKFKMRKVWLAGFAAVAILLLLAFTGLLPGGGEEAEKRPLFAVRKGPMTISVTESGTIKARDQLVIKSRVEGKTTILWLVPEAAKVTKGDLLVELDAAKLEDDKILRQIEVQSSRAGFIKARETLAVGKNRAESEVEKGELTLAFARHDLDKYVKGEYPNDLKEAAFKILLADEELQRAAEKLKWSKVLFKEKYISATELTADELSAKKAELDLELARNRENLLKNFTYRRQLAELTSDVKQAEMALARTRRKALADVAQADAELIAAETRFKRQQNILAKIEKQILNTRITAPESGVVVYATSAKANWRGNAEPLAEGQQVRERQELIYLPTSDRVKAEVKVHESSLSKIRAGQEVAVRIDAIPGNVYSGRVEKIALLPDAQSMWLNPELKVYATEIFLDGDGRGLRTGMSCSARIVVETYEDTLFVPLQAVVRTGDGHAVYLEEEGRLVERSVTIGLDNNSMVRILTGLSRGEEVVLTPPLEREDKGDA